MSGGRAILRLPFPDIRTWSWYKGERTLKSTSARYDVSYRFLCGKAWAIVRWSAQ